MDNSTTATPFQWDDEKVTRLIALDAAGVSASKIAVVIDAPSRDAVIGKIRRLGLRKLRGMRGNNHRRKTGPTNHFGNVPTKAKPARAKVYRALPAPAKKPPAGSLTVLDLEPHHCRWPIGNGPYHFCGAQKMDDSPYCLPHTAQAWRREL